MHATIGFDGLKFEQYMFGLTYHKLNNLWLIYISSPAKRVANETIAMVSHVLRLQICKSNLVNTIIETIAMVSHVLRPQICKSNLVNTINLIKINYFRFHSINFTVN